MYFISLIFGCWVDGVEKGKLSLILFFFMRVDRFGRRFFFFFFLSLSSFFHFCELFLCIHVVLSCGCLIFSGFLSISEYMEECFVFCEVFMLISFFFFFPIILFIYFYFYFILFFNLFFLNIWTIIHP